MTIKYIFSIFSIHIYIQFFRMFFMSSFLCSLDSVEFHHGFFLIFSFFVNIMSKPLLPYCLWIVDIIRSLIKKKRKEIVFAPFLSQNMFSMFRQKNVGRKLSWEWWHMKWWIFSLFGNEVFLMAKVLIYCSWKVLSESLQHYFFFHVNLELLKNSIFSISFHKNVNTSKTWNNKW